MNCRVVVEAAVPVFDVGTEDEAIRIAISKTGEMLNPDLNYVEIDMGERTSPDGEELPPAFIAADEALVALELEMTVFNVEREEHASRIARKEIGQRLENIPLEVLSVDVLEDDEIEDETEDEETGDGETEDEETGDGETEADAGDSSATASEGDRDPSADGDRDTSSDADRESTTESDRESSSEDDRTATSDDDVLPEFEDLLE